MQFDTTNWSVVLHARSANPERRRAALEDLCRTYWYPLYGYARRRGLDDEAADVTQAFFVHLIEKHALTAVDPAHGRFRAFLVVAFRNFLNDAWHRERALKRGGHLFRIEFDPDALEHRYRASVTAADDPDALFEREWALTLLDRAFARVRTESAAAGKARQFEFLSRCLTNGSPRGDNDEVARALDMTPEAVRVAVYRLRRRFAAALREEVAATVSTREEIADELRHLMTALGADAGSRR